MTKPIKTKSSLIEKRQKMLEKALLGIDAEQFRIDNERMTVPEMLAKYQIGTRRYYKILESLKVSVLKRDVQKRKIEAIVTVKAKQDAKIIQAGYLNFIEGANLAVQETLENISELKRLIRIFDEKISDDDPEMFEAAKLITVMRNGLDGSIKTLTQIMKFGKELDETQQIIRAYQNVLTIVIEIIAKHDTKIRRQITQELYDRYRMTLPTSLEEPETETETANVIQDEGLPQFSAESEPGTPNFHETATNNQPGNAEQNTEPNLS